MRDFFLRRARKEDLDAVCKLLETTNLPLEGVAEAIGNFVVAEGNGGVLGAVGLEVYGRYGLLRSAVVAQAWQGYGAGRALVGEILSQARIKDLAVVYLLTTTAENYFPSFGFKRIERDEVPEELSASAELRGACPSSAVVMRLEF